MTNADASTGEPDADSATASEESATHVLDAARAGGREVVRGRSRCRTSRRPSVLPEAGRRAASCRARRTPHGSRRRDAETRSISSRSRRRRVFRSSARSGTGACWCPRSPSSAAAPTLMAADLADGPRTGLHAQLCGDAHLSNFGIFAAPDRRLVFSINDFDETLPGPFEWDVKRLAASFAVAGRERGFDDAIRRSVVTAAVREYREAMARFAEMRNIRVWYARLDVAGIRDQLRAGVSGKQMKRFQSNVASVRTKDSMRALTKLCRTVDGELRIVGNPPLVTPIEDVLPGAEQAPPRGRRAAHDPHLPAHAAARPAPSARELPVRARGPQGRRRRQRGRPDLDPAPGGPRRGRSAVPPVQGGAGIGARAVSRRRASSPSTDSASSRGSG